MKTGLWTVVALVTGIVGFLVGYSVSGYTGTKSIAERSRGAHGAAAPAATVAVPAKAEAGGYGAAAEKPVPAPAGGYGAAPEKPAAEARRAAPATAAPAAKAPSEPRPPPKVVVPAAGY